MTSPELDDKASGPDVSNVEQPLKTVYFIRHAESEENRRLFSMKKAFRDVVRLTLPKASDIGAAVQWLNFPAQIDSEVSSVGEQQISEMAMILQKANFVRNIQLVARKYRYLEGIATNEDRCWMD